MPLCKYILTSGEYRNTKCGCKFEFSENYCDEHLIILGNRKSLNSEKDISRYLFLTKLQK